MLIGPYGPKNLVSGERVWNGTAAVPNNVSRGANQDPGVVDTYAEG